MNARIEITARRSKANLAYSLVRAEITAGTFWGADNPDNVRIQYYRHMVNRKATLAHRLNKHYPEAPILEADIEKSNVIQGHFGKQKNASISTRHFGSVRVWHLALATFSLWVLYWALPLLF